MRTMQKAATPVIVVVTLALAGVFAFFVWGSEICTSIGNQEVFKMSYQFLLLVVVGGAISLLYKRFSDEQEYIRERRGLLRQMHSELLDAFNTAKRSRRILRTHVTTTGYDTASEVAQIVGAPEYDEQMNRLIDAQLAFEMFAKRAKSNLWFARGVDLARYLGSIEDYLNGIIGEYEDERKKFSGSPPCIPLSSLPKLAEFIGPYKTAIRFQSHFRTPFQEALSALETADII